MSRIVNRFNPQVLLENLSALPASKRLLVGYSGGADSTALLLALHQLSAQLECKVQAVHFHHGLQDSADDWELHCRQFCRQRNIPLEVQHLDLQHKAGSSYETMARRHRYQCIAQLMEVGDVYLTAHQADDQAETLFINLLRGSGSDGLSGIPQLRKLSRGWLARPLLNVSRAALETWLLAEKVQWISDPSNQDLALDRNFLRSNIFPQLENHWPGVMPRLNQSAAHMRELGAVLRELLRSQPGYQPIDGFILGLQGLDAASLLVKAEIIRNWARENGAPPPPRARLQEFLTQIQAHRAQDREDGQTEIRWAEWLIKHHAGYLWMHELPIPSPCPERDWVKGSKLQIDSAHGLLQVEGSQDKPFNAARVSCRSALPPDLENLKSARKKIKEIMRLSGIPVWLRDAVPLLFLDGNLAAVGDWWLAPGFRRMLRTARLEYRWQPQHALLKKIQSVGHNAAIGPEAVDPGLTLV